MDDASTDATTAVAARCGARILSVDYRQIAATRNAGAAVAQGDALVFVDADKTAYGVYLEHGLKMLRSGGVIAFDNALWHDRVADPAVRDADTTAIRDMLRQVSEHEELLELLHLSIRNYQRIGAALLGHLSIETTRGYVAVFDDAVVVRYQQFLDRRREQRPPEEHRQPTSGEWTGFEEHFDKRKVDLVERRATAVANGWQGEIEGVDLTPSFLRNKRNQTRRSVGMPRIPRGHPDAPPHQPTSEADPRHIQYLW